MVGTTIKQSTILVSAGLDQSTADMSYITNPRDGSTILTNTQVMTKDDIPCWSMEALWEICREMKINLNFLTEDDSSEVVINTMVEAIVEDIKENLPDAGDE